MLIFLLENGLTTLTNIISLPSLNKNQFMTVNGKPIENISNVLPFSIVQIFTRLKGGALQENEKALAMKRFNTKVCRKCNARLSIRATHCRKRQCGFSNKLRMKKKLREVGKK
ncbi:Ubiquitin/60s ribosomal protein L40 fusion [Pseudoloma neurophilia]|uniref:Ubiquitin/60s ribosomal protein L40 fusion n=1 Tax=Pseudoloma neurophilia TaxID=146866 RepID=A0A0R0LU13_9MICR|nr:Ubiquitin/60s ribosomal protein L40 fusion [Pseudoloma neurophilia]